MTRLQTAICAKRLSGTRCHRHVHRFSADRPVTYRDERTAANEHAGPRTDSQYACVVFTLGDPDSRPAGSVALAVLIVTGGHNRSVRT